MKVSFCLVDRGSTDYVVCIVAKSIQNLRTLTKAMVRRDFNGTVSRMIFFGMLLPHVALAASGSELSEKGIAQVAATSCAIGKVNALPGLRNMKRISDSDLVEIIKILDVKNGWLKAWVKLGLEDGNVFFNQTKGAVVCGDGGWKRYGSDPSFVPRKLKVNRYVRFNEEDNVYRGGKTVFKVKPGDEVKITGQKVCRSGKGQCFRVSKLTTDEFGFVYVKQIEDKHNIIFRKQ